VVLKQLEGFSLIAGVSKATSIATIDIGESAVINAHDFSARSTAESYARAIPIGIVAGVAVGIDNTTSEVTVDGTITTTGDLTIRANGDNTVNLVAKGNTAYAAATAISVINSTVSAQVTDSANLTVGGNLSVWSETVDHNRTSADSATDKGGQVAVAAAISVEHGDTHAYLDGAADVTGDISVNAHQEKQAVSGKELWVIPAYQNGVSADAGVGESWSPDDITGKLKKKIPVIGKLAKNVKGAVIGGLKKVSFLDKILSSPTPNKFDVGAAVTVVIDKNTAEARIGDGKTDDGTRAADIEADGSISVAATTANRPALTASSAVTNDSKPDEDNSVARFGGSVAVVVGRYSDTATAVILQRCRG